MDKISILIGHQSTIPHYRVSFYYNLYKIKPKNFNIDVIINREQSVIENLFPEKVNFKNIEIGLKKVDLKKINFFGKKLLYQNFLSLAYNYDIVILGSSLKNITYPLTFKYRSLFNKNTVLWGHGKDISEKDNFLVRKIKETIRMFIIRESSLFFAYTNGIKRMLINKGICEDKIFVLNNTININKHRKIYREKSNYREKFRIKHNLNNKKVLLFVGRLNKRKKLYFLKRAFNRLYSIDSSYFLIIIGGGTESFLKKYFKDFNPNSFKYLGVKTKPNELAEYYILSDLYVFPGDIGLGPLQSLCYSLPPLIVDSCTHGPEYEYLNEKNSIILPKNTTSYRYAYEINRIINNKNKLNYIKSNAWDSIKHLTIENMAENFIQGLNYIIK